MKQIVILFCLLFFSAFCYAQNYNADVVYLKNGSVIRGIIIEQVPNQSLRIKTVDGNVFAYDVSEVEKITKEELAIGSAAKRVYGNGGKSLKGYKSFVDVGYTFAKADGEDAERIEVSTSSGYQFDDYLFVGGGVAFHYYHDSDDLYTVPIFANFRANFVVDKSIPFVDFRAGYSIGKKEDDIKLSGIYAYAGVGVGFQISEKMALNFALGYSYQKFEYYYYGWNKEDVSCLNVKFGFEF